MAENIHILNGDTLDGRLLRRFLGRKGFSNYAPDGLEVTADYGAAVYDVSPGLAFILDNGLDTMVEPPAVAGQSMATDGVNHIYLYFDLDQPDGEKYGYYSSSSQTPPSHPSLRIAEVDMAAEEVTPVNREPPRSDQNAVLFKGQDIDSDGDGVVDRADEADLVQGSNVSGAVAEAQDSQRLGGIAPTGYLRPDTNATIANETTYAFGSTGLAGSPLLSATASDADGERYIKLATLNVDGADAIGLWRRPYAGEAFGVYDISADTPLLNVTDVGDLVTNGSLLNRPEFHNKPAILGTANDAVGERTVTIARTRGGGNADIDIQRNPFIGEALAVYNHAREESILNVDDQGNAETTGDITAGGSITDGDGNTLTADDKPQQQIEREAVIRSPNVNIPIATLEQYETVSTPAILLPGEDYVTIWTWGVQTASQTALDSLPLYLYDESGTQQEATTSARETGNPGANENVGSTAGSGASKFYFELQNNANGQVDAGFYVGYHITPS